jgi:hypothetical protein
VLAQGFGSPQQRFHPRQQFREAERLDQIIVGAQFQPSTRSSSDDLAVSIRIGT